MKIYRIAKSRQMGYKVMLWDEKSQKAMSVCDNNNKIDLVIGKTYRMSGDGIYLGNSKDYVLKYFYVEKEDINDPTSILLSFEFDTRDIIKGDYTTEYESEFSVSKAKLIDKEILG